MSSTQQGNSGAGETSQKAERNRRSWSQKEEATLLAAIKELVVNGWKSDNGFRAGYLNKLEDALHKAEPNTDLKALPHVASKLSSWKKSYYSLLNIIGQSGVGFNSTGNNMIDCEDAQWQQIVKMDSNARLMRFKVFPHFNDWKKIFGKDRATGEHAEDVAEAAARVPNQQKNSTAEGGTPFEAEFSFENELNEDAYDQVSQSARDDHPAKSQAKKPKMNAELHGICEMLSDMNQATNSRLEHLASRIGYEFYMGKARQETFDQLGEIRGLTMENRFIVCELIAFKMERLDIWRGMKPDARADYVEHLIKMHRHSSV